MRKLFLLCLMLGLSLPLLAQSQAPLPNDSRFPTGGGLPARAVPKGPTPRLPNKTPDLSGVWQGGGPIQDLEVGLAPNITKGAAVRVKSGPLRGMEGFVEERQGRCFVLLRLDFIRQAAAVRIEATELEVI